MSSQLPAPLTNRLRKHLPRAAALAVASRMRNTTQGKTALDALLGDLDPTELRDVCVLLGMFVDTGALAHQSLEDPLEPIEAAVSATATRYGVTIEQLRGRSRVGNITEARHVAAYVANRLMDLSLVRTGKLLDRDHTTVLHSVRRVDGDPRLQRLARDIAVAVGWQPPAIPTTEET